MAAHASANQMPRIDTGRLYSFLLAVLVDESRHRAAALQDHDRNHHVPDQRDGLDDRLAGVFIETDRRSGFGQRDAHAQHADDAHDLALREAGPPVGHLEHPQARRIRSKEEPAGQRDGATDRVDVDDRFDQPRGRRAVVGQDQHQDGRDDDGHERRHGSQQRIHRRARQALQQRPVMRGVTLAAGGVGLVVRRQRLRSVTGCLRPCLFASCVAQVIRRFGFLHDRLAGSRRVPCGQCRARPAQHPPRDPSAEDRGQQRCQHGLRDLRQHRAALRVAHRVDPPCARGRQVEQRDDRMPDRGAGLTHAVGDLPRQLGNQTIRLERDRQNPPMRCWPAGRRGADDAADAGVAGALSAPTTATARNVFSTCTRRCGLFNASSADLAWSGVSVTGAGFDACDHAAPDKAHRDGYGQQADKGDSSHAIRSFPFKVDPDPRSWAGPRRQAWSTRESTGVKGRVQKIDRADHAADDHQRGAIDIHLTHFGDDIRQGAHDLLLIGPARAIHHGNRTIRPVVRQQFIDDPGDVPHAEMNRHRRPVTGEIAGRFAVRHRGFLCVAGQNHGLRKYRAT